MSRTIQIISTAVLLSLSATTLAANVTVIAEGVLDIYDDPDGQLPFSHPAPGTEFRLVLTYDDQAEDTVFYAQPTGTVDLAPDIGIYKSISFIQLTVGGQVYGELDSSSIIITDDSSISNAAGEDAGYADYWGASTTSDEATADPNQSLQHSFGLALFNQAWTTPISPLTSDDLVQPVLEDWEAADIWYGVYLQTTDPNDGSVSSEQLALATATVTSLSVVPIPGAIWLLGSALAGMGWFGRRRGV